MKHKDLKQNIKTLINNKGFVIISIGDHYIQILNEQNNEELYFEAVSNSNLPELGYKNKEFEYLSFNTDPNGNYYKTIPRNKELIKLIIQEIKTIFELIYSIKFNNYEIELSLDSNEEIEKSEDEKEKYAKIIDKGECSQEKIWQEKILVLLEKVRVKLIDNAKKNNSKWADSQNYMTQILDYQLHQDEDIFIDKIILDFKINRNLAKKIFQEARHLIYEKYIT